MLYLKSLATFWSLIALMRLDSSKQCHKMLFHSFGNLAINVLSKNYFQKTFEPIKERKFSKKIVSRLPTNNCGLFHDKIETRERR